MFSYVVHLEVHVSMLCSNSYCTSGNILQVSEFFITNYTVEEFLNTNMITRFEGTLSTVFQQEGAAVTKIINPLERGVLVPPPPAKHGYVLNL